MLQHCEIEIPKNFYVKEMGYAWRYINEGFFKKIFSQFDEKQIREFIRHCVEECFCHSVNLENSARATLDVLKRLFESWIKLNCRCDEIFYARLMGFNESVTYLVEEWSIALDREEHAVGEIVNYTTLYMTENDTNYIYSIKDSTVEFLTVEKIETTDCDEVEVLNEMEIRYAKLVKSYLATTDFKSDISHSFLQTPDTYSVAALLDHLQEEGENVSQEIDGMLRLNLHKEYEVTGKNNYELARKITSDKHLVSILIRLYGNV